MADTYLVMLDYRYMAPNQALAMATAASVNALRLDEWLADAHTSLAHAKLTVDSQPLNLTIDGRTGHVVSSPQVGTAAAR